MSPPEPEKSLDHRLSTTLERLERLTAKTGDDTHDHRDPATVEEALTRLKCKVIDKDG